VDLAAEEVVEEVVDLLAAAQQIPQHQLELLAQLEELLKRVLLGNKLLLRF
jgi:hypothetical protein